MAIGIFVFFLHAGEPGKSVWIAQYTIHHFTRDPFGLSEREGIKLVFLQLIHYLNYGAIDFLMKLPGFFDFALQRLNFAIKAALDFERSNRIVKRTDPLAGSGFLSRGSDGFEVGRNRAATFFYIDKYIVTERLELIDFAQIAQVKPLQRKGSLRPGAI